MDVTTVHNLMSSFWPRVLPLTTSQNQLLSVMDHHQQPSYTTPNMLLSPQGTSREPHHHFGQIRISPTMALIDAQYGLPTAAVAEMPRLADPMEHGLSALTSRSGLPPQTPSSTSNSVIVSRGQVCCPPSTAPTPPALDEGGKEEDVKSSLEEMLAEALGWSPHGDKGAWDLESGQECAGTTESFAHSRGKGALLCQVCSDNASGFHYGINSCEGCKGFFRRSIQQKIQYKTCAKNKGCAIVRSNRNRCQFCRFQKCLAVGMSRDAVRFGRVPKREKVKMQEAMQSQSMQSQTDSLAVELEDDFALVRSIENGFEDLAGQLRGIHKEFGKLYEEESLEVSSRLHENVNFSLIQAVVSFAKSIKGFHLLDKKDCIHLLKNAIFQVLLLRWCSLRVECKSGNATFLEPSAIAKYVLMAKEEGDLAGGNSLHTSIADFTHRFRLLGLDNRQTSIFAALILCQPDSVGGGIGTSTCHIHQARLLKMLQEKLSLALQSVLFPQPPQNALTGPLLNQSLFAAFADLKALNGVYQQQIPPSCNWRRKIELKRRKSSSLPPPFPRQHGLLATLAAVAASVSLNGAQEAGISVKTPTRVSKNKKEKALQVVDVHSPFLEAKHPMVGEMPTLRRCLAEPPMSLPANVKKVRTHLSLIERHREVASLLEKPASHNNNQPLLNFLQDHHQNTYKQQGEQQEQEDQPLNLCIREMNKTA